MSESSAKDTMRLLAAKAAEVVKDETKSISEKTAELDKIEVDLKAASDEVTLHAKARTLMSGAEAAPDAKAPEAGQSTALQAVKSLGQQVIESDAYKTAVKGGRFALGVEIGTKVAGTIDEGTTITNGQLAGAGGVLSLPNYVPGVVPILYAPLSVVQLFAQGATDSPIVSYVKQATETVGAAARAEKATTGQSDATFSRVNEQVGSVSALFKITDEMLQDAPQVNSFMTNHLVGQLQREEEDESLNGSGYPELNGVLGRTGLQTAISAGTTGTLAAPMLLAEAIFKQRTVIRTTAFVEPDAVVINPTDWQHIQLAKDGNDQYYAGGPFSGAYGNGGYSNVAALWGLKVVQSPRIAAGTALVGGFNECGQLFRRQGITVDMTNSDGTDFDNHVVAVRATSRSALAIWRPGGFGTVTITWA